MKMKITRKKLLEDYHSHDWLCREIMNSMPSEVLKQANIGDEDEFDIKIVINGVETEPSLFRSMFDRFEEIIDREAKALMEERANAVEEKLRNSVDALTDAIDEARRKIMADNGLEEEEGE